MKFLKKLLRTYKNNFFIVLIALFGGIGTYILSSNHNLGFSPDSVSYFEVANSLQAGNGLRNLDGEYVNHWPPGYSAYIALLAEILGISTMHAGTVGNAFIVFFIILILAKVFKSFQISSYISCSLLLVYLFSPIYSLHLWLLSEGLFILFFLISFLFLQKWSSSKRYKPFLFISALMLGLSVLVRYAGIGFIAGFTIYLTFGKKTSSYKILISDLLVFITGILAIILPWYIYSRTIDKAFHDRTLDFQAIPFEKFEQMFLSFGAWLYGNFNGLIFLGIATLLLIILFRKKIRLLAKSDLFPDVLQNSKVLIYLTVTYILFIIISASFLDHAIPLSGRIFSPLYYFFLIVFGLMLTSLEKRKIFNNPILMVLLIMISYSFRCFPIYVNHYKNGSGFTSVKFSESLTIKYLANNYANAVLYANDVFIPKIYTKNSHIKLLPRSADSLDFMKFKSKIISSSEVIVYLDSVNWRNYIIKKQKLEELFKDRKIMRFKDGIIITNKKE